MKWHGKNGLLFTEEMQRKREEMQMMRKKHLNFAEKAKIITLKWLEQNNIILLELLYSEYSRYLLSVFFVFKKEVTLQKYKNDGTLEKIKNKFLEILNEIGYFQEFNANIVFDFDSEEYIKENVGPYISVVKIRDAIMRKL